MRASAPPSRISTCATRPPTPAAASWARPAAWQPLKFSKTSRERPNMPENKSDRRDIVIIGGGHNGLATAFYLARAGFKPLVLERRAQVGGAAITDEFHPGFRCSTLAHAAGPLRADILGDMQLEKHGLRFITPETCVTA